MGAYFKRVDKGRTVCGGFYNGRIDSPRVAEPRAEPGGDGACQDPPGGGRARHLDRRRLGLLPGHQDNDGDRSLRQRAARQPRQPADARGHRLALGRQRDELAERAGAVWRDPLPRGRRLRRALGGRFLAQLPEAAEERRLCREAPGRRRGRGVHPLRRSAPRAAHRPRRSASCCRPRATWPTPTPTCPPTWARRRFSPAGSRC